MCTHHAKGEDKTSILAHNKQTSWGGGRVYVEGDYIPCQQLLQ